jgi:methylated-DNA-[protein]-cysteine S-methyltransferase
LARPSPRIAFDRTPLALARGGISDFRISLARIARYRTVMPWTMFETAIGPCGMAWSDVGVTCFQLPEESRTATKKRLYVKSGTKERALASERATPPWVRDAIALAQEHLAGSPQDFTKVPLDLAHVSAFDAEVLRALVRVPAGTTVSYGDLAKAVGKPGAARAVGRAMAANPIPLIVPCHRVLAAKERPGGFSAYGGLVTKERMLALEGFTLKKQKDLFAPLDRAPTTLPFDADAAVRHLTDADPVLGKHIAKVGPFSLRLKNTESTFAALAEAIVYQQLNGKAAATIFGRVSALFPNERLDPKHLLATSDAKLRAAGLSKNKLASLRDLALHATEGRIPTLTQLGRMEDDAIVDALTNVRGIGRWTVEMLLMFRLGRPDVLPIADYGIQKGFARVFPNVRTDITRRGERWRPYRSVASWYLWRATDAG